MRNVKERIKFLVNQAVTGAVRATLTDHPDMLLKDCHSSLVKRIIGSLVTPSGLDSLFKIISREYEYHIKVCGQPNSIPGPKAESCWNKRIILDQPTLTSGCNDLG